MLHIPPTNLLSLAAKQDPYKKSYLLTKNIGRIFWKKFRRMDQQASHALVAVFMHRDRAVFQVAVHEVTGLLGLCSCGLSVPAQV